MKKAMAKVMVPVSFTGMVEVEIPAAIPPERREMLAGKVSLARLLATTENPDAPEDDALPNTRWSPDSTRRPPVWTGSTARRRASTGNGHSGRNRPPPTVPPWWNGWRKRPSPPDWNRKTLMRCSNRSGISPHTLRHTKAMHLLQSGVPIITIKDVLGHATVRSTEVYVQTDPEVKRKALEQAGTPSRGAGRPRKITPDLLKWLESL